MRKGMRIGSGKKGYYNVIGTDPRVHAQSAMGMKQPQRMPVLITKDNSMYRVQWNRDGHKISEGFDKLSTAKSFKKSVIKDIKGGKQCSHVFDDVVGYGVHCVKCGYKPANLYSEDDIQFIGKLRGEGKTREEAEAILVQVKKIKRIAADYKQKYGGKFDVAKEVLKDYKKKRMQDFEQMRNMAELRALSNVSLQRPLNDKEYNRMMQLKKECLGGKQQIMPEGRISYNPLGYLKSHGYKIVRKPKDAQYQGVGEEGVFFYSKKTGKTYIQSDDGKYYAKFGGKLPFSKDGIGHADLPIENAVYVPSTDKNQKQIPQKEFRKRIAQTENTLTRMFGGFTRFDDYGGYKGLKGDIIKEKGARVVSFASAKDAKDKQKLANLKEWLLIKQKQWGQESIGYENEGDLHYIWVK